MLSGIGEGNGTKPKVAQERHECAVVADQLVQRHLGYCRHPKPRHALGCGTDALANAFETAVCLMLLNRRCIDRDVHGFQTSRCKLIEPLWQEPTVRDNCRSHVPRDHHRDQVSEARVEKRLAAEEADVANTTLV